MLRNHKIHSSRVNILGRLWRSHNMASAQIVRTPILTPPEFSRAFDLKPVESGGNGKPSNSDKLMFSTKSYSTKSRHEQSLCTYGRSDAHRIRCRFYTRVTDKNSLAAVKPEFAAMWHPTKNGDMTPANIHVRARDLLWWKCSHGHEWQTSPKLLSQKRRSACSVCDLTESKSLAIVNPDVANEFHPDKNDSLTPSDIHASSSKRVWWKCSTDPNHEWKASPDSRTGKARTGCPLCSGHTVSSANCLANVNAEVAAEFHATKNGNLTPTNIHGSSKKTVWWQCRRIGEHMWQSSPKSRTRSTTSRSQCPFCAGMCVLEPQSIAVMYPAIASEFDTSQNTSFSACSLSPQSNRAVWWRCPRNHVWQERVSRRVRGDLECPTCLGEKDQIPTHHIIPRPSKCLTSVYPDIAQEFHFLKNGNFTARSVHAKSDKQFWWQCPIDPDHEWKSTISNRTGPRKSGCPFCSDLNSSKKKSLRSCYPDIAQEFNSFRNGHLTPESVHANSNKRVWWRCRTDPAHEWKAIICNRTGSKKSGCPFCSGSRVTENNCLANVSPELSRQFHSSKNVDMTPETVHAWSNKHLWWECSVDPSHEWRERACNRIRKIERGCPFCSNERVSSKNSLSTLNPELST
eukprot:933970_1